MYHVAYALVLVALGFGLGRTKHFDKLIAAVKNLRSKV